MVLAERLVGIDSQLIDWGGAKQNDQQCSRVGLSHNGVETMSPLWAKDADLTVTHSAMPVETRNYGKPNIVALHGRPEYAFELERRGVSTVLGLLKNMAEDPQCVLGISFWPEHIPFWETMYPELKIEYVPAMVDLPLLAASNHAT